MTSKRLPGKVLLDSKGIPLLVHLINRLKKVRNIDAIVLATTLNKQDDVLEKLAIDCKIGFFRGDENDVMGRVLNAGEKYNADVIVEITGDCPIIDHRIVEQVLNTFLINNADFVNNNSIPSYPDGMDTRVFSLNALKKSYGLTTDALDKEHVTLHMKNNPEIFSVINLIAPSELNWPELGLTLDEYQDYILIDKLIQKFYDTNPFFGCDEIINYLKLNPEFVLINKSVIRKQDY